MGITKAERKEVWIDQIKTAIGQADKSIIGVADDGTCNFDMVVIEKERFFTYAETIELFKNLGISAYKMSAGYIGLPHFMGQANRNTTWVKSFEYWLKEQGFKTSIHYQMD